MSQFVMAKFEIDVPPKPLHPNGRLTWQVKARHKSSYQDSIYLPIRDQKKVFEKHLPIQQALVQLEFHQQSGLGQHQHDKDNLIAWAKYAIDVFEKEGVLENDRHLHWKSPVQVIGKPKLIVRFYVLNQVANMMLDQIMGMLKKNFEPADYTFIEKLMDVRK